MQNRATVLHEAYVHARRALVKKESITNGTQKTYGPRAQLIFLLENNPAGTKDHVLCDGYGNGSGVIPDHLLLEDTDPDGLVCAMYVAWKALQEELKNPTPLPNTAHLRRVA